MKYFPLVWAGLWRKQTRTVFTLLSIVVAFLLFGLLQGVDCVASGAIEGSRVNRLYTVSRISFIEPLPMSYLAADRSRAGRRHGGVLPLVRRLLPGPEAEHRVLSDRPGADRSRCSRTGRSTSATIDRMIRTARRGDRRRAAREAVRLEGRRPRAAEDAASGRRRTAATTTTSRSSASTPARSTNLFLLNYDYFNEARSFGQDQIGWFPVSIKDPTQAAQVSRAIDALFANSPNETKTQTEKEFAAGAAQAARRHQLHRQRDRRRGAVHAAVPHRQHDDAVGARAHPGAGGAEDARIHGWHGDRAGARGVAPAVRVRRAHRARARRAGVPRVRTALGIGSVMLPASRAVDWHGRRGCCSRS